MLQPEWSVIGVIWLVKLMVILFRFREFLLLHTLHNTLDSRVCALHIHKILYSIYTRLHLHNTLQHVNRPLQFQALHETNLIFQQRKYKHNNITMCNVTKWPAVRTTSKLISNWHIYDTNSQPCTDHIKQMYHLRHKFHQYWMNEPCVLASFFARTALSVVVSQEPVWWHRWKLSHSQYCQEHGMMLWKYLLVDYNGRFCA